jgi:hypothetical protein
MPTMAFNRMTTGFVLLIALSSFAVAHESGNGCKTEEFWWENNFDDSKNCCLPWSPPEMPPPPPQGQCPNPGENHSWYYHDEKECCVPTIPQPPPPECPSDCYLDMGSNQCIPQTSYPPQPSGYFNRRSKLKSRDAVSFCPTDLDACPIPGLTSSDYECVDTKADLESCGGCTSTGDGKDCSALEGVWNVGCEKGACIIYTCAAGYRRAHDGKSCIAY